MPTRPAICLDCAMHAAWRPHRDGDFTDCALHHVPSVLPRDFVCTHFRPAYWEAQGHRRDWGDAAVMLPELEILRAQWHLPVPGGHEEVNDFVVLAPGIARRPIVLHGIHQGASGSY